MAATGLIGSTASADTLSDLRQQATAAQRAASAAGVDVSASEQRVAAATQALQQSTDALAAAQARLADVRTQLQAARDHDAQLAQQLEQAQEALAKAKAAVVQGQGAVDAQRRVLGEAARGEFQQQSDIEGFAVALGAQTTADLSQRLQWSTTIFDTSTAEKARLDGLLIQLESAKERQAAAEAKIAADKEAAAAQVAVIARLEEQSSAQAASVQQLVAQNTKDQETKKAELAADQLAYQQSLADAAKRQAEVNAEVARQAELARQQAIADAQRRAAEAAAARARLASASRAQAAAAEAAAAVSSASSSVSGAGFIRPVDASPGSPFGMRFHPILHVWRMHEGQDFGASCGSPIYAARDGRVMVAQNSGGNGNYTVIGHGTINGTYVTTWYLHQSRFNVSVGDYVHRGDVIGYVGSTGMSTGCHLHFEMQHDGTPVDPMRYVP